MSWNAPRLLLATALVLQVCATGTATAQDYEPTGHRSAKEILPAPLLSGPYHHVDEKVVNLTYQNIYTVQSEFGTFRADNDPMLRRLIREIYALAEMRKVTDSDAFTKAAKDAAKAPLQVGYSLLTDPVDTVSGIPEGAFALMSRTGTSIGTFFAGGKSDYEDDSVKAVLAVSSFKREYANRLGIDVYTRNKHVQEELNRIGWAAVVGNMAPSVAFAAVGGGIAGTFKTTSYTQKLNNLIAELPPPELRKRNEASLKAMGLSVNLIKRFLDHKSYSPRHETVIVESLAVMKGAKGRDKWITALLNASSELDALFFQQATEMMAGYHQSVSPVVEVTVRGAIPIVHAQDRSVGVMLPIDYGRWTRISASTVDDIAGIYGKRPDTARVVVWVTGTLSARLKSELGRRGFVVTEEEDQKIALMD